MRGEDVWPIGLTWSAEDRTARAIEDRHRKSQPREGRLGAYAR